MIVETVPAALAGERLDRIVALMLDVSRSLAAAVIDAGGAAVDGRACTTGKLRLLEGQEVAVDPAAVPVASLPGPDPSIEFDVVHVDDTVIVVDKPAGLVVHPGAGNPDGTLVNGLLARFPDIAGVGEPHRPGIVHRLDGGSSGLLVVARTQDAADSLIEQFASHQATRVYVALVWGHPEGAARCDRRADRAIAQRPVADGGRRRRQALADRVPRAADASTGRPSWRCSSAGSRPAARTRSASTSARSTIPWWVIPCTASAARACSSSGRSCTPRNWPSSTRARGAVSNSGAN